ncbi:MAG: ATP-binding protein [Blastocatellia bacterium]
MKVENNQAIITIAVTGLGIPTEDLPHIFERFFRRSAKTSDRSAATFGLGLSIVKWIVASHEARSKPKARTGNNLRRQAASTG